MAKFGRRSRNALYTCHDDLIVICEMAIRRVDFAVTEGLRSKELQNLYYDQKKSKIRWPNGKHNVHKMEGRYKVEDPDGKSRAVDVVPWPVDWNDRYRFVLLGGVLLGCAHALDIPVRWGGDWNQDFIFNESFVDMPHLELM